LISASGYQAHTTSPSALAAFVNAQRLRPSRPAPDVRDDRETPLVRSAGRPKLVAVICPTAQAEIFREKHWTDRQISASALGQRLEENRQNPTSPAIMFLLCSVD
jgi:hypothetical protein